MRLVSRYNKSCMSNGRLILPTKYILSFVTLIVSLEYNESGKRIHCVSANVIYRALINIDSLYIYNYIQR